MQRDRQRDDHPGAESVADLGVFLDDERCRDDDAGSEEEPGHDPDDDVVTFHHNRPFRNRLATPMPATTRTVISPRVSRPRKSVMITVTASWPCAAGVRASCSFATFGIWAGWESALHRAMNMPRPAAIPARRFRPFCRGSVVCLKSGATGRLLRPSLRCVGSRPRAMRNTNVTMVSTVTATRATFGEIGRASSRERGYRGRLAEGG